jgi:Fur family peroxide stress response transcriptional regulator
MAFTKAGQDHLVAAFRDECRRRGLASTHQREVIYRVAASRMDHPTPEAIYDRVKREIPSVSLATVYKNLKMFLEAGLLREVTIHHGSLRLDPNTDPHHHLVCERCKSITDLPEDGIEPVRMRSKLPKGFHVQRYSVEFIGLCPKCAQRQ